MCERLGSKRQETTDVDMDAEKKEPLCTDGEIMNWYSWYGNKYGKSPKINYHMVQQFHLERSENTVLKSICPHPHVPNSSISNSQDMKTP